MFQFFRLAASALVVVPTAAAGVSLLPLHLISGWLPAAVVLLVRVLMPGEDNRLFWVLPGGLAALYLVLFGTLVIIIGAGRVTPLAAVSLGLLVNALVASVAGLALDHHQAYTEAGADE